jgi:signal transduction histidine kinase
LHAKVRATGVCEAIHNQSGQRVGTLVLVNSPEDLEILQPPAADPFARPTRHLSDLLRPDLQPPDERARIEGTVLHIRHEPLSELYLRTRQGAIRVEFTGRPDIAVGDRIAAVGYPALSNKQATLLECVVRRIGHGPPPDPAGIEIGELLESGRHSDLVKIHGKILRNTATVNGGSVFLESSNRVAEVLLPENLAPGPRRKLIDQLRPGASVALAGIAVLRGTMSVEGTVVMTDMQLLLRGPADVTLLARPSWWTTGRLLALAASLAAVLALSFLWVLLLRRRVAAQTEIIREKIVHETRWIERSRIARDIHDDAGSALTQIMLLGELGRRGAGDDPEAGEQFQRISRQAREAVRALDAIVWTTNPKNDSLAVTVSYICQTVQDLARDAGISCRLEIPDDVPPVSVGAKVRHNLLLAVKEAAHNVIKHSDARMLRLRIVAGPDELRIGIVDDGHGFDPARVTEHRTGMESMRKRMEESGGSFEIASGDGSGTSISFILPWSALG